MSDETARKVWGEAMADPAFVEAMERGRADFAAGRTYKWADIVAGRCGERKPRDRNRTCQRHRSHEGRHRYAP